MSSETQLGSCSSGEVVSPSVATHGRASKVGVLRSTEDGRRKHNRLCDEVTEDDVSQPLSNVKKVRKLEVVARDSKQADVTRSAFLSCKCRCRCKSK